MNATNITNIKGYKIDFVNNTLIMNYKFNKQSGIYGSPEYNMRKAILDDFPSLTTVVKSGRVKKTARPTKRLTYDNMRTYIRTQADAHELLARFETIISESKPSKSPYKYVKDWFVSKFPNYTDAVNNDNSDEIPTEEPNVENIRTSLKASGF